eukprot:8731677-Karenia_brevis.AAC.1
MQVCPAAVGGSCGSKGLLRRSASTTVNKTLQALIAKSFAKSLDGPLPATLRHSAVKGVWSCWPIAACRIFRRGFHETHCCK